MGRFASTYSPKSQTGGISDNQMVTNLAVTTAASAIVVGLRSTVAISVTAGSTAGATQGVAVRFGLGTAVATATDFQLPLNTVTVWEMGNEFDRLGFFNTNGTGTVNIAVMRLA